MNHRNFRRSDRRALLSAVLAVFGSAGALPVAAVGVGAWAGGASAQVTAVSPYFVVVTSENVNLRCGSGSVWYPVSTLSPGDVLRVDGHEFGWLRVDYPAGTLALVKSSDARLDEGRGSVTLTRPSRLLANNPRGGVSESWRPLMDADLPSGTELAYRETVNDASGAVAGYRVVAPAGAKGFVSDRFVRKATDAEVAAALGTPAPAEPAPVAGAPTEGQPGGRETYPVLPAEGGGQAGEPAGQPAGGAQPAQPMQPEGGAAPAPMQPAPGTTPAPAETIPPPVAQPGGQPGGQTGGQPVEPTGQPAGGDIAGGGATTPEPARTEPVEPPAPPAPRAPTLEDLNAAYEALKRVPTEQAEIEPLMGEYQKLIDAQDDSPRGRGVQRYANAKIELLRARLELQQQLREISETERNAEIGAGSIADAAAALAARPRYTVVGRLSASTVYDGTRLPLMYRVLSVEGFPGRTLAYVTPAPNVDLRGRVGQLVGIIGDGTMDASLGVAVLRPTRVDALTGRPTPPPPPTGEEAPTGADQPE